MHSVRAFSFSNKRAAAQCKKSLAFLKGSGVVKNGRAGALRIGRDPSSLKCFSSSVDGDDKVPGSEKVTVDEDVSDMSPDQLGKVFGTWNKDTARGETRESKSSALGPSEVVDSEDTLENARKNVANRAATPLSGIKVLTTASKALRGDPEYQNRVLRYKMDVNPRVLANLKRKKAASDKKSLFEKRATESKKDEGLRVPPGGFSPTDVRTLRKFLWSSGKIKPKRITGLTAKQQRRLAKAVKQARQFGLIPSTYNLPESLTHQVVPDAIVSTKASSGKRRERPTLVVRAESIENLKGNIGAGRFGYLMKQISRKTSAKVEVSNPKLNGTCHVNIIGKYEDANAAKQEFEKVISVYGQGHESIASKTLQLEANVVGAIFGPCKKIRRNAFDNFEIDVLIDVDGSNSEGAVSIKLLGSLDSITRAEEYLGTIARDTKYIWERVEIEKDSAGLVIGKKFTNLNRIAFSSGAYLNVSERGEKGTCAIDLYGTQAQISSAKRSIELSESVIALDESQPVSAWLRASVKGGETGQLLKSHGVKMDFQNDSNAATIVGPGKQAQRARTELEDALLSQVQKRSISIPDYQQSENAVHVLTEYLRQKFDTILISNDHNDATAFDAVGPKKNLNMVSTWLQAHVDTKVIVPSDLIKFVIGEHGSHVKRIRNETGSKSCAVDCGDFHIVYFYGSLKEMTKAKALVENIVDRQVDKGIVESTAEIAPGVDYHWGAVHRWTGALTNASPSSTDVNIFGENEAVIDDVKGYISRRTKHSGETKKSSLLISNDAAGQILGRSGSNLEALHVLTGASISYDNGEVSLVGPEDQVEHAERLIRSKVVAISQESMASAGVSVEIPVAGTGLLMGNMFGENSRWPNFIARTALETGTLLQISQSGVDERKKTLTAYGAPEQVSVAVDSIQDLLENTELSSEKMQLAGKMHLAGALIGENGEHVRQLQERYNTKILLRGQSIEIHGERSLVRKTMEALEEEITKLDLQKTVRVRIPKERIGEIVGKGGKHLREIRSLSGAVRVAISQTDSDWHANHIEIQGTPQQIKAAKAELRRKMDEIESSSYESFLKVPREHIAFLLGKDGEVVRRIADSSNSKIQLLPGTEEDEYWRTFSITGPAASTKSAKESLMSIVLERDGAIVEDTLNMPDSAVGTILGKGGSNVREFELQSGASIVIVGEAGGRGKTVTVQIKGAADEVEVAKNMIVKTVKAAEEQYKGSKMSK